MRKTIYRLAPCPTYDAFRMQTWLEDMAKDGWFLRKDGWLFGFWCFEAGTPRQMRYRLIAAPNGTTMLSEYLGDPAPEALELSAASGWVYLEKCQYFHIYATADPHAPEMETDLELQDQMLGKVCRRAGLNFLILLVFLGGQHAKNLFDLSGEALCFLLQVNFSSGLTALLLPPLVVFSYLLPYLHLRRLRRRPGQLSRKKDWRRHALFHRVKTAALPLLLIAAVATVISSPAPGKRDDAIPYSSYTGALPFSTMEDLLPGTALKFQDTRSENSVEIKHHFLAPQMISLFQNGTAAIADGGFFRAQLRVEYYEMRSPRLAQALAQELLNRKEDVYDSPCVMLELSDTGADLTLAYTKGDTPHLILADGVRVLYCSLYQNGTYELPPEEWMPRMAQDFLRADEAEAARL